MPAAVIPLIVGGISAGTTIYAANKQAGANRDAISAQTDANNRALQFEETRYADASKRLQPWTTAGQTSTQRMAHLLGLPDVYTPPPGTPPASTPVPAALPTPPRRQFIGDGPPVAMRAPDGTIEHVLEKDVAHYEQLGAKRVTPGGVA